MSIPDDITILMMTTPEVKTTLKMDLITTSHEVK